MNKNKQVVLWFIAPLMAGFCLSGLIALQLHRINSQAINDALDQEVGYLTKEISERLNRYEYGLRAVRGVVLTAGEEGISRELFRRYSMSRDLEKEFPGAHGFGFIRRVPEIQETDFLAKARLDGKPDFGLRQLSPHNGDRYVIQYIEPSQPNSASIGLDIASEQDRRQAAEQSMRTGGVTLTAPITLVQATGNPLQSFLILLPVYRTANTPVKLVEREAQLLGWSFAPLIMNEVLANLRLDLGASELTLRDITQPNAAEVFFMSEKQATKIVGSRIVKREFMGRNWQIEFGVYPEFVEKLHLLRVKTILVLGFFLSVLIASLLRALNLNQYRKRAIFKEQVRIAAIVENSIDAIIGKTLDGVVTSWNRGAEAIFGYTAAEAIGRTVASLIVPEHLLHEEADILIKLRHGKVVPHFITMRLRKDGSTVPVSVVVAPIRDSAGAIIGASKTVRDITEQKVAEDKILDLNLNLEVQVVQRTAQLDLARRSLQTVLDAIPSMIGYWDKNLINRVANRAYHEWFGLDHLAIPGMHARELLGEKLFELNRALMEAALRGEPQTFSRTIATPKGERHSLGRYIPDIENGEVQGFYVIIHDLTEVTEANNQLQSVLRENQALLSTINQQMLYSVTDTRGTIISVNDNFCTVTGYDREEIIGKNHRLLNSGTHPAEFWVSMWQQITKGETWHAEVCNRSKSGELFWFDTAITPFTGGDGKIERYVALRTNITERKNAARERRKLNYFINSVLNAATEISIIATDLEGLITVFNRGAERMLGYNAEEIVGKTSPAIFHKMDEIISRGQELSREYNEPIEGFRALVHKPEIEGVETRNWTYIHKNGSQLHVSLIVTPVRDENSDITGYLGVATDITSDVENKKKIESTLAQLDIAAKIAELGIWSWDIRDDSLQWSDCMFDMYDQPKSLMNNGLSYQHWYERVHPDDVNATEASLVAAVEGRGVYDPTFRVIAKNGDIHFIQASALIEHDVSGNAIKVTGINRDITTQKELEATLTQAKEAADAASAAKSAFLANMSHEIRTPMNAVLGMLQLLQYTPLTVRQQDYLSKSQGAAKSLLGLLNDILDFSKIDSGKLLLDNHPFELEPLLRDLAVILSANQGNKPVEVMFDIDPRLPAILITDRLRLQQILINLAGNALKFTHHGQVLVTLKLLEKNAQDIRIQLVVSDTGIGISPEQVNRIFEGFVQAETSITRRYGGTGLGLVISKRLIDIMGGELKLESEVGVGSRFWFDLQLAIAEAVTPVETSQNLAKLHVLVVDDIAISREVLTRTLQAFGVQTDEAAGGAEALEKVRAASASNNAYDIVLMDWHMPDLDGLRAAELIKNSKANSSPPIIIMVTAYGREEVLAKQTTNPTPYSALLNKPVTPEQLKETILRAVMGEVPSQQLTNFVDPRQQTLAGLHLLVVEDNELNRQVASELLAGLGAIVELAEGGLEGVSKVVNGHQSFDLVIMDVQMPDIDGLEATRRIRENLNFKTLPILAMTANASSDDRAACLHAGMNDHIGKPINMDELVPCILALVGRETIQNINAHKVSVDSYKIDNTHSKNMKWPLLDDSDVILKRFGGKIELCKSIFIRFYSDVKKLLDTIEAEVQQKNPSAVTAALHSIKGVAATMGAKVLAAKAAELEKEFKLPHVPLELKVLTEETRNELSALLAASNTQLQQLLDEFKPDVPVVAAIEYISAAEWDKSLVEVLALLESDSLDAIDKLEQLHRKSPPNAQAQLAESLAQVNELQFTLAISTITHLLRKQ